MNTDSQKNISVRDAKKPAEKSAIKERITCNVFRSYQRLNAIHIRSPRRQPVQSKQDKGLFQ